MANSRFDILVALILSGEATEKQKFEFDAILRSSKEKQIAFQKLKKAWGVDVSGNARDYSEQKQYLWARYQTELNVNRNKTFRVDLYARIAASIVFFIIAGFVFSLFYKNETKQPEQVVVVNDLVKETHFGEKLKSRLPDGTTVNLNAGSKLVYPECFSDSDRVVQLIGECFFDVAEDKSKPFTVRISTMDIIALGTSFSVDAYKENTRDQVALVTGKLLIKNTKDEEIRIDGGETVTLSRKDNKLTQSALDYLAQVAWKDGLLCFNNNSFDEIVDILELNYGVEFAIDKNLNLSAGSYSGSFKNESLENLLSVISFSMNFKYEIYGKKIVIENK